MQNHKTRLMTISGATLALVIASTASVAAFGPRDDDREFGPGKSRMGAEQKGQHQRGMAERGAMRAEMRDGIRAGIDDFERRETIIQTADGISARRTEQGVVESASDASLSFTLGSGEAVTVTIDEDTEVIAFDEKTVERGRWSRQRMVPTEVDLTDIETGTMVVVWSDSEDGGDFVAGRVVVRPVSDEATDEMSEDEAEAEAAVEEVPAEEAAATDA